MIAGKTLTAMVLAAAGLWTGPAAAHCDTLDGPVVSAARQALATGQVERALIWVRPSDEGAVREAFAKARALRTGGGEAAHRAEHDLYATLVKVHREGEGAPFTGLKPAGTIEPAVRAADQALRSGRLREVEAPIVADVREGLAKRFGDVRARRGFDPTDVNAGRAYVAAYVDYVHHVERLHGAASATSEVSAHAGHAGADDHDHGKARPEEHRKPHAH